VCALKALAKNANKSTEKDGNSTHDLCVCMEKARKASFCGCGQLKGKSGVPLFELNRKRHVNTKKKEGDWVKKQKGNGSKKICIKGSLKRNTCLKRMV
jgi:hypothetical protein